MELINYEGGPVLATAEPLTVRGLLLPYNEVGRTNVGRFQVEAGDVTIPSDPAVVGINTDHVREDTVGRAVALEDTAQGVFATYRFADTAEGRAAYEDAINPTGKRTKLSAEFGPVVIKAGRLVNKGIAKLWGSAMVEAGAFPSAMVLASDTPDDDPTKTPDTEPSAPETPDDEQPSNQPEEDPTVVNPHTLATALTPDAEKPDKEKTSSAFTKARPVDLQQVFAAIANYKNNPSDREAEQVLASLTDIVISGSNNLPGGGDALRPNWVGQMYDGIPYVREYLPLGNLGTAITAGGKKGFKVNRGTSGSPIPGPDGIPNGGTWAGNKTDINSYNGFTESASSTLRKFAVGQDIAREFYDLPGGSEVVEAFLKLVIEDYLYWSDNWGLYDIQSAAALNVAANATYPTDYPAAVGQLIQGILAVKKRKADGRRDVPTFAIANDEAYAALAYAAGGAEHLPAFVSLAVSTSSEGRVDGNVEIVQGDTGITGSSSVIVGAKKAIEFDELPGGPLVVNALEIAKGGIDRAVHGYLQTFNVRNEAMVLIGTIPARANSTAYGFGDLIKVSAVVYHVEVAGTSGGSGPSAPAVGATVADGTATLRRLV